MNAHVFSASALCTAVCRHDDSFHSLSLPQVQKRIQAGSLTAAKARADLGRLPCNADVVCDQCGLRQKNRMFCYSCGHVFRLPMCAECGRCVGVLGC